VTSAEFWAYDGKLGRRWNVDPVIKYYESAYATFGNNPISIIDPTGADSIFYNKTGTEINRIPSDGDHTYFLDHENGNKCINGKSYYQGYSYYSFFGDSEKFKKPTLFKNVDTKIGSVQSAVKLGIDHLESKVGRNGISKWNFCKRSAFKKDFDFKNSVLSPEGKEANLYTAYLLDGILYNRNEVGNIMWGAATFRLGWNRKELFLINNALHLYAEGNGEELNEWNAMNLGRHSASCWVWVSAYIKPKPLIKIPGLIELYPIGIPWGYEPYHHLELHYEDLVYNYWYTTKVQGVDPTSKQKDAIKYEYTGKL